MMVPHSHAHTSTHARTHTHTHTHARTRARTQNWCDPSPRVALQTRSASRVVRDNVVEEASYIPHARNVAVLMPFASVPPAGSHQPKQLVSVDDKGETFLTA